MAQKFFAPVERLNLLETAGARKFDRLGDDLGKMRINPSLGCKSECSGFALENKLRLSLLASVSSADAWLTVKAQLLTSLVSASALLFSLLGFALVPLGLVFILGGVYAAG